MLTHSFTTPIGEPCKHNTERWKKLVRPCDDPSRNFQKIRQTNPKVEPESNK